jgi:nitrate reductase / nitrite oxidoreductase, beta subunit
MTEEEMYEMYRLLAIAKYEERYVIPTAYAPQARDLEQMAGCSLDGDGGPGMYEDGPVPVSVEAFHAMRPRSQVNLLTWNGQDVPSEMFPQGQKQ